MRIGVLGGGQLGRMLALAGLPMGLEFVFIDPAKDAPMESIGRHICANYDDETALDELASRADIVTYEFENILLSSVDYLSRKVPVVPSRKALEISQERLFEKSFLKKIGIPVGQFCPIDSLDDIENAARVTGLPAVLKTRRFGYDGKGQRVVATIDELTTAVREMISVPLILEKKIDFKREMSMMVVRNLSGETAYYPLVQNEHRRGILYTSAAPAPNIESLAGIAEEYAGKLLTALGYAGLLTIEFFETDEGLLVNEFAPRVHNSGHWTIEGAVTSQFENHLRAILDYPLGSTDLTGYSKMINLVGALPSFGEIAKFSDTHIHYYGKSPKPSRKVGHITVRGNDFNTVEKKADEIIRLIEVVY